MKRRDFLKSSSWLGAFATVAHPFSKALAAVNSPKNSQPNNPATLEKKRSGFACVQVFTDDETAQFRIVVDPRLDIRYGAVDEDGDRVQLRVLGRTVNPYNKAEAIDHLIAEDLQINVNYKLQIFNADLIADERFFSALETNKASANFAVLSCTWDYFEVDQAAMWLALQNEKPDLVFMIGDQSYANVGSLGRPGGFWRRHLETRHKLDFYWWKRLVPVLATWDDHDYGGNNSDSTNPVKYETLVLFRALFGSDNRPNLSNGETVNFVANLFGQRFYLMDDRFHRDPLSTPNGSHWGQKQEDWLFESLGSDTAPAWIMNGNQFFGGYNPHNESMQQDHPVQFKNVLNRLAKSEAPVVFVSGDVHFSEFMRIEQNILGYETYEITSSSMHSMTQAKQDAVKNPRRIASTWRHNFIMIKSEAKQTLLGKPQLNFHARCTGKLNAKYFEKDFTVTR